MKLEPVPFTQVRIADVFWAPRQETNRTVSIPHSLAMLERSGNLRNMDLAAAGKRDGYSGPVFMDSDLYKAIEAAAFSLAARPDPALDAEVDRIVAHIAAAQMPDGYLNTHYQVNEPDRRWTNLRDNHELYCAGHLFEAAVAHYQATGKRTLLDVALRFADCIDRTFGPGPEKRPGYCGHPEIELALVKLWRATGERRYFELARHFVETRGSQFFADEHGTPRGQYDGAYCQDDVPIREHRTIKGHAVRAAYLMAGVVDVAAETGDTGLLQMVDRVWRNTVERRTYVTGGIGPSAHNEGFTTDYDLPNRTAYQETCASIAMAMWSHRLALLYGDSRYADALETALYNGVLAGVSLDGYRYFYTNPLESVGTHHRLEWYGCACCPPNVTRTVAALGQYAYATGAGALVVNLFIKGSAAATVDGRKVRLDVATRYPWDGAVRLIVRPESPARFALLLRKPGWCEGATVRVNGAAFDAPLQRGYHVIEREWQPGDRVSLSLPMPVRQVRSHPRVRDNAGLTALQRGPIVYCFEQRDQSVALSTAAMPVGTRFAPKWRPDLLGGVVALHGDGSARYDESWSRALYRPAGQLRSASLTAVPYCVWDNREAGAMRVWMPETPDAPPAGGPESTAQVRVSFQHTNSRPAAINDGIEPRSSADQLAGNICHWWPHLGGREWVQYTWPTEITVAGCRVYWFDDTGTGACRIPAAWEVQYLAGGAWRPVVATRSYETARDRWCEVAFEPVRTRALRIVVTQQYGYASGIHEWHVGVDEEP
ncbi:MAG TPA: beta-L-arabinofuranosidase domain-containing protein [Chthonomonadales bacterium]|nr:beta-L-arabinofuranosidase domain-containing protein [Chthonomonadales bacterium]